MPRKTNPVTVKAVAPCEPLRVTLPQAGAIVGESVSRLYEKIRDGKLRVAKEGSRTLVTMTELRRYVAHDDPVNQPLDISEEPKRPRNSGPAGQK